MSATDSIGYFIELGENNLIVARTNLSQRPRAVDELREVWLGDAAAVVTQLPDLAGLPIAVDVGADEFG